MGTDIHLYVERRDPETGAWSEVPGPFKGWNGGPSWNPVHEHGFESSHPDPSARNYNVFAMLAGVRNGYGFAGTYRHEPLTPCFEGRGIPEDHSPPTDADLWLGDHSFTWATVAELLTVPWGREFHSGGVVGAQQFRKWEREGRPTSWSGMVSGQGIVVHDTPEAYRAAVADGVTVERTMGASIDVTGVEGGARDLPVPDHRVVRTTMRMVVPLDELKDTDVVKGEKHFCRVSWTWTPLVDCDFKRWVEDVLAPIAGEDTESVRVLMGFDS